MTTEPSAFNAYSHDNDGKNENPELSLSLSYQKLPVEVQERFRATGVLALEGTFDRAMLAALWGDDEDDARAPLQTLLDVGLLEDAGERRFTQHRLLRAYARALLDKDKETDASFARYAEFVTTQSDQFNTLPSEKWNVLDPLLPHIKAVGDELVAQWTAVERPNADLVVRAENFAASIRLYVYSRSKMIEDRNELDRLGLRWVEIGLSASRQTGNQEREALFNNALAWVWSAIGEKRRALAYYEQALLFYRAVGDRHGEVEMLNSIGVVCHQLSEPKKALNYHEQALPLRRAIGDRSGEANTLNNMGLNWHDLGQQHKALDYYERALLLRRAIGDRNGEAITMNSIGAIWLSLGEKQKALDYYEQALLLRRAGGDLSGEATTLTSIGAVWFALGEKHKALDYYEQALPLRRVVRDRRGEATTLNNIGEIWRQLGENHKALDYYEQALLLFRAVANRDGEATALNNMALIYYAQGDLAHAADSFRQIILIVHLIGMVAQEALYQHNLAQTLYAMKQPDEAIQELETAIAILKRHQIPYDSGGRSLEQHEETLAQWRGRLVSPTTEQERWAQIMAMLKQVYDQQGEDAVRSMCKANEFDADLIEQLIAILSQS
jgi:tetratricopeptide (TPR) repeat protein